jgi:hypothetical protein
MPLVGDLRVRVVERCVRRQVVLEFGDSNSHFSCLFRGLLLEFGDLEDMTCLEVRASVLELFELRSEGRNFGFESGGFSIFDERGCSRVERRDIFVDFEIAETTGDTEGEARVGESRYSRTERSEGMSRDALLSFGSSGFGAVRDRGAFDGRERGRSSRVRLRESAVVTDGS